ncbi:hypothetical protein BVG16_03345 [Paenibacillus selenitireducens]|uniref:HTH deoR-type domain-containing protein n=1 Tax=Paenibacillus selenitireducens TaxID=1324314 RepID=A0A1T2XNB4_9BACL|nr:DeoR/GlpR family DNA-binding transcription regulator [Paenibacillus selenitireducens]OPA81360.1 hypothetical protein BVG16_03345 [Paenibacillus selenitireducens]
MSIKGEERKQSILQLLHENGRVESASLVKYFNVSFETIRRDLEELEGIGKLKRMYGGAMRISEEEVELPHLVRETTHVEEKARIGERAAQLVQPGDVIFIDEGTTPVRMIPYLLDLKSLTIVTSSFPTVSLLMDYSNQQRFLGKIIFLGGEVSSQHARVVGSLSEQWMEQLYVDKAFVSIDGFDLKLGITSFGADKATLTRKVIQHAKVTIVMADASKINVQAHYRIAELDKIHYMVCDKFPPAEWVSELEAPGVIWLCSDNGRTREDIS